MEIEVTRSSLDRLAIYAALRVPEVWRYDWVVTFHVLDASGIYAESSHRSRLSEADSH
jgi:hypothetical protein